MGDGLARRLELFAGYPTGYMDLPPEQAEEFNAVLQGLSDRQIISALQDRIQNLSLEDAQTLSFALLEKLSQQNQP